MKKIAILAGCVLLVSCRTIPSPPPYDPACFDVSLPVGVPYPSPRDPLERLFPSPRLAAYPNKADDPIRVITVRRVGPYSEPEAQLSLFELADGTVRAEFYEPRGCSVSDQLYRLFFEDRTSTEEQRLQAVRVRHFAVTERQLPLLREIFREFQHLRISTDLFAGLVLDQRSYTLRVETPLETLQLTVGEGQRPLARWAERAIAAVSSFQDGATNGT